MRSYLLTLVCFVCFWLLYHIVCELRIICVFVLCILFVYCIVLYYLLYCIAVSLFCFVVSHLSSSGTRGGGGGVCGWGSGGTASNRAITTSLQELQPTEGCARHQSGTRVCATGDRHFREHLRQSAWLNRQKIPGWSSVEATRQAGLRGDVE